MGDVLTTNHYCGAFIIKIQSPPLITSWQMNIGENYKKNIRVKMLSVAQRGCKQQSEFILESNSVIKRHSTD